MGKDFESLSENERKFLKSIIGEGKKTDTEIAEDTGLSVSTANRIRHSFEEQNIIKEYIPVIDLEGVSLKLYAIIEMDAKGRENLERIENGKIVFAGTTDEANQKFLMLVGYKNYESYRDSIKILRDELSENSLKELNIISEPDSKNFVLRGRSKV